MDIGRFCKLYKEVRGYLYGTPDSELYAEAAYEFMKEEAEKGNAYAMQDLGKIYQRALCRKKSSKRLTARGEC